MSANPAIVAIIDDDLSFREALEGLVKSFGFATMSFDCPIGFMRSARRREASCLIVDMQMPAMSGLDLQESLEQCVPVTPIIFVTAFPDPSTRSRALAAGAIAILGKPVDTDQLMRCLRHALAD